MIRFFYGSLLCLFTNLCFSQDKNIEDGLGLTYAVNYTFSGIGMMLDAEWQNKHHIFYTGPMLPISRSYLPVKGPFGWNIGYRHEYNKSPEKVVSFFFNADYQISISKAYSQAQETSKKNYVQELFIGYGVQFKLFPRLYLANVLGIGGHLESYYSVPLQERRLYAGYNNLFKLFLNYKF